MRILVVEDEKRIASFIERGLKEQAYSVDLAYDGETGIFQAQVNDYDCIVLDLMLPGKNGIAVCQELRASGNQTPIMMLTAMNSVEDKVRGLDAGADDYLAKPFAFDEFLARIRVLLRRKGGQLSSVLRNEDLELDQRTRKVQRAGKEIELTNKEYALLEYFMQNAGQVVTKTMIAEHVWNEDYDSFTNVIAVYVNYLRKKVDKGFDKQLIHSVRGVGYILKI